MSLGGDLSRLSCHTHATGVPHTEPEEEPHGQVDSLTPFAMAWTLPQGKNPSQTPMIPFCEVISCGHSKAGAAA